MSDRGGPEASSGASSGVAGGVAGGAADPVPAGPSPLGRRLWYLAAAIAVGLAVGRVASVDALVAAAVAAGVDGPAGEVRRLVWSSAVVGVLIAGLEVVLARRLGAGDHARWGLSVIAVATVLTFAFGIHAPLTSGLFLVATAESLVMLAALVVMWRRVPGGGDPRVDGIRNPPGYRDRPY